MGGLGFGFGLGSEGLFVLRVWGLGFFFGVGGFSGLTAFGFVVDSSAVSWDF